ncbi:MAG: helix-turn-helix transcriptional regulator [Alphaproteobacteria bacterium]|nr:helix-turn-helix transcriptional regulator [Alphaproteobacteria bacterium]
MDHKVPNTEDLGRLIRETRKEQGLTQDDLAGLTGTGRRFIIDLERGKDTAQIGKVLLVLAALGIAIYALSKWK